MGIKIVKKYKAFFLACIVFSCGISLGGCESGERKKQQSISKSITHEKTQLPSGEQQSVLRSRPERNSVVKLNDVDRFQRCRRELEALKKLNSPSYHKRKTEFDKLLSGALTYNSIRTDIDIYTVNAVDALYRFRADKVCADISNDVLNTLSNDFNTK